MFTERIINFDFDRCNMVQWAFYNAQLEHHLTHTVTANWWTEAPLTNMSPHAQYFRTAEGGKTWFFLPFIDRGFYATAQLDHSEGSVTMSASAHNEADARKMVEWCRKTLPPAETTDDSTVPLKFWYQTAHGPVQVTRRVEINRWTDVSGNYPVAIRQSLKDLVEYTPRTGGQLILFQGPPGTGKTSAIRTLANEWRQWAKFSYITDPDEMFMKSAGYLIEVLLDSEREAPTFYDENGNEVQSSAPRTPLWRVLVLEDSGELLAKDAKVQAGQGLSRLLNTVDGLIGQGLNILVLVTTNEPMGALHEAVTRPGRCIARIDFPSFTPKEVYEWYAARGAEHPADKCGDMTLADLYASLSTHDQIKSVTQQRRAGFQIP